MIIYNLESIKIWLDLAREKCYRERTELPPIFSYNDIDIKIRKNMNNEPNNFNSLEKADADGEVLMCEFCGAGMVENATGWKCPDCGCQVEAE